MKCWHCDNELDVNYQSKDFSFRFYHCSFCDRWYEMRKEKSRSNSAVPIRFSEMNAPPELPDTRTAIAR